MKQRVFRPVEESVNTPTVSSKIVKENRLAVKMPLPEFSNDQASVVGGDAVLPDRAEAQLKMIDARHVIQNSHPPRQLYTDDAIKVIAESIKMDGQRDPIHVIEHPTRPGHFIIGDGWTRVQAVRSYEINDCQILARVHSGLSEEQASWLGYAQNESRSQHTDFDRAMFFQGWHNSGLKWEEISKRTGLSKTLLSFYASYEKLPAEILSAARNFPEKITATVAQQLARAAELSDESKAMLLTSRFISGDMPQKWLKDEVAKLSVEKKPREHRPAVSFQRRFGVDGAYKQRSDGRVEMMVAIPLERTDEFNTRMVALLSEFMEQQHELGGAAKDDAASV